MSAERGWIGDPQPTAEQRKHSVEAWAERHRMMGHHPYPAPTDENPERWDCDCVARSTASGSIVVAGVVQSPT